MSSNPTQTLQAGDDRQPGSGPTTTHPFMPAGWPDDPAAAGWIGFPRGVFGQPAGAVTEKGHKGDKAA